MIDPTHILSKYPASVPRYTSYPTAPHFQVGLGEPLMEQLLDGLTPEKRISVYIHIPFCDRLCWFCGCNTKHTKKYAPITDYVTALIEEIFLITSKLSFKPTLDHLHFGGGSPSLLSASDFTRLRGALACAFEIDAETEIGIEVDPSDVTGETLVGLQVLGLTRASIGVQDFDPAVQKAINRPQTFDQTSQVVGALRATGIRSLNIDALYGLPLQTLAKVKRTMKKVVKLRPERIALFGYAHVPWLKKHQQMINEADLPSMLDRFAQAELAAQIFQAAGYQKIGIDHFALPSDPLAQAARAGTLHRNFQGYTTDRCDTLLGLGGSSIGQFGGGYIQNIVPTGQYQDAIRRGELAALKGVALTRDDIIRGHIIERLMCDFGFSFDQLRTQFGEDAAPYIEQAHSIADAEEDGLCALKEERFYVPDEARPFVRLVAARFDAYLTQANARYSAAI